MSPRQKAAGQPRLVRPHAPVPPPAEPVDRDAPCYVQLGKFGDIVNLLPVLRDVWKTTGVKPYVVVAQQYASIFDGVSYVRPLVFGSQCDRLGEAVGWARSKFDNVTVSQVWSYDMETEHKFPSYNQDQWRVVGYADRWNDRKLRLEFDRRNYVRERALIQRACGDDPKPVLLLNLTGGHTSPFPSGKWLQDAIVRMWSDTFRIVDLQAHKTGSVFDMLGLMEIAAGLITTDTVHLHMAGGVAVPMIALVPGEGLWKSTTPHGPVRLIREYGTATLGMLKEINQVVSEMLANASGSMRHVHEDHLPLNARELRARESWDLYRMCLLTYPRSALDIGDRRELPYLRDVLELGIGSANHSDIVLFTNSDTVLVQGFEQRLRSALHRRVMVTGRRIDVPSLIDRFDPGRSHWGRDVVAWRAGWLRMNFDTIPDFLLGASEWDLWAAAEARKLSGEKWTLETSRFDGPAEIPVGLVLHEAHDPEWVVGQFESPSQIHNRKIFKAYWQANNIEGSTPWMKDV